MQSAASDGERVFFGAENMFFYALDAETGQELWRRKWAGRLHVLVCRWFTKAW